MTEHLHLTARLWRWTGATNGTWHFVTIDGEPGAQLSSTALMRRLEGNARGFGSLKVKARIGGTRFVTSVFPSKAAGLNGQPGWLLPVKRAVRRAEDLAEGDAVELFLEF
ncbi:DUF1905 domain-containing protein [Novosphingobium colocasiae]|uniref:DUF1905 domain-containing protein n=1 Tax=Novosphingobium colocasiae TaxID=1256513 RepID=UPI0035B46F02